MNFCLTPIEQCIKITPQTLKRLHHLGLYKVIDCLKHTPTGLIKRQFIQSVEHAEPHAMVVMTVYIKSHPQSSTQKSLNKRQPFVIQALCNSDSVRLIYFNVMRPDYLCRRFPVGGYKTITGRLEFHGGLASIVHPEIYHTELSTIPADGTIVEPVYPLTAGLTSTTLRRIIHKVVDLCPQNPEWHSNFSQKCLTLLPWTEALKQVHHPQQESDPKVSTPGYIRLAFDELLANQLAILSVRKLIKKNNQCIVLPSTCLRKHFLNLLPFQLTQDQNQVIQEIDQDLGSRAQPMMRLLQGDVGSGKTVVAMMAILSVVEAGFQAAFMAPTEILARQHGHLILKWAEELGLNVTVLTGKDKGKKRDFILKNIELGTIHIIVGTHALIQDTVHFHKLGLVIIDEQHRFGVEQRLRLVEKGSQSHILSMTATPIPRTLMLTCYNDLDCSYLREKPAFRQMIETKSFSLERLDDIVTALRRAIDQNHKAFWICPLVEESEYVDLAAAQDRYTHLKTFFPENIGLIHGRLSSTDKSKAMDDFKNNRTQVLVATTVIEVGIDIPDATLMIIEHAERFGLAQLHQLRGRIGRGTRAATCMLLYQAKCSDVAKARLRIMRQTNDGFLIAEEDMRLRGAGEIMGLQQSGAPPFAFADLSVHQDLLKLANREAEDYLSQDKEFSTDRGRALKCLLEIFNKQQSLRYINAV